MCGDGMESLETGKDVAGMLSFAAIGETLAICTGGAAQMRSIVKRHTRCPKTFTVGLKPSLTIRAVKVGVWRRGKFETCRTGPKKLDSRSSIHCRTSAAYREGVYSATRHCVPSCQSSNCHSISPHSAIISFSVSESKGGRFSLKLLRFAFDWIRASIQHRLTSPLTFAQRAF